jgi:hypothetical protein
MKYACSGRESFYNMRGRAAIRNVYRLRALRLSHRERAEQGTAAVDAGLKHRVPIMLSARCHEWAEGIPLFLDCLVGYGCAPATSPLAGGP